MICNFKYFSPVMIILCYVANALNAQSPDTLKGATIQEKSEALTFRMERELGLTKEQSTKVNQVFIEALSGPARLGSSSSLSLETADRKALQKLVTILNNDQYALYQELRAKKKQDKDKYLKDHPGVAFSREDLEMDF